MTVRFFFVVGSLIAVTLGSGCRRQPLTRSQPAPPAVAVDSSRAGAPIVAAPVTESTPKPTDLNVQQLDFHYLTARSRLSFKSKDQDLKNANVTIRMQKDSLIWFTIGQLGLTGARGQITRDSVVIVNILQREVYTYSFAELSAKFGIELNYNLLQSLLVGNLPIQQSRKDKVSRESDYLLLRQDEGKIVVDNYIGERDRKLKKLEVKEQATNNALKMEFEDFNALNNFLFPYSSLITVDYLSNVDRKVYQTLIEIKHQKVDLTDERPSFPFSIPSRYERKK